MYRAFDAGLTCSLNLCPVFNKSWKATFEGTAYAPAGKYQKELSYAVAIEDKAIKQLRLMLIDENDAEFFKQQLAQDQKQGEAEQKREVRMALYHFESGTVVSGKEGIDPARFERIPLW